MYYADLSGRSWAFFTFSIVCVPSLADMVVSLLVLTLDIDRQNLAAAKLAGVMEDLNMTTQQFATAISILFVGYLPFQLVGVDGCLTEHN